MPLDEQVFKVYHQLEFMLKCLVKELAPLEIQFQEQVHQKVLIPVFAEHVIIFVSLIVLFQ